MKTTKIFSRLLSLLLVLLVVAAMTVTFAACGNNGDADDTDTNSVADGTDTSAIDSGEENSDTAAVDDTESPDTAGDEKAEITITVKVKGSDGNVTDFVITTAAEFLRGALEQENLVEGEESDYGLYVKVVNGETADYDVDKSYWSFYKGDEYLMTGVDTTPIADGDVFRIEYTKD